MTIATTEDESLSGSEAEDLRRLERTLERMVDAMGKIAGDALATIRDRRLYRATHSTFEGYCNERWGFSRWTANRLIAASAALSSSPSTPGFGAACTKPSTDGGDSPTSAPGRPDSPFVIPEPAPEPPEADFAERPNAHVWAAVAEAEGGRILAYADDADSVPAPGQRVLIAWVR